jgi:hypothetical protein
MNSDLMLRVHLPGAEPYEIGDEIWQPSLAQAMTAEAEVIAQNAGAALLESPSDAHREQLRDPVVAEMTAALTRPGDRYRAPDGARYSLTTRPDDEP